MFLEIVEKKLSSLVSENIIWCQVSQSARAPCLCKQSGPFYIDSSNCIGTTINFSSNGIYACSVNSIHFTIAFQNKTLFFNCPAINSARTLEVPIIFGEL